MTQILEAVIQFLEEDEWPFQPPEPGEDSLFLDFAGENGKWRCVALAKQEEEQLCFYSISPDKTPEEKRSSMAEFLTRANFGLSIGNFEFDFEDGEIRFKTSIDVEDDRLSQPLIKHLVYTNVVTMDKYVPGIAAIMYADISPIAAIAQIEGEAE